MPIATYDPKQVLVTFNGQPLSGYADGTMVSIETAEDLYALTVGADGKATRVRSQNLSGSITITLMQTSLSNDLLFAAFQADQQTPAAGVSEFQLKDANGRDLVHAANAWVKKLPTLEYGKEQSNREWVLESDRITYQAMGGYTAIGI